MSDKTDTIPAWVTQLYTAVGSSGFQDETKEVTLYNSLTDSTSFCLYTISTGTCFRTYLATQKNRKDFKQFNIQQECEEELSEPEYSFSDYKIDSIHNIISVTYDTIKPKSKFLQRKGTIVEFKKGYNMDNSETYDVIKSETVIIRRDGKLTIKKQNHP